MNPFYSRCGTHLPPEPLVNAMTITAVAPSSIDIDVYFHVIANGSGAGVVTDQRIDAQISHLNMVYNQDAPPGSTWNFRLAGIQRWTGDHAHNGGMCGSINPSCAGMYGGNVLRATATAHGGLPRHRDLVVATTALLECRILGYSELPWGEAADAPSVVVIDHRTLPGDMERFEGDTLTHEVGHWLGLYHTFENGCKEPSDYVDDTPFVKDSSHRKCDMQEDSCPDDGLGPDLLNNFMDYVSDACMNSFTPGQQRRMRRVWAQYRME